MDIDLLENLQEFVMPMEAGLAINQSVVVSKLSYYIIFITFHMKLILKMFQEILQVLYLFSYHRYTEQLVVIDSLQSYYTYLCRVAIFTSYLNPYSDYISIETLQAGMYN